MDEAPEPKTAGVTLDITVFVCGALVMVYEIVGSRIVAPYIGTSTYIWTSLIGVILGALSLGYWLGGRVADRRPNVKILASVLLAASGLVSFTIIANEVVLSGISLLPAWLEVKSLLASIILFAPASIALGFVTPFAVRLRIVSLGDAGKTVGRLYALSTVGSIAGTFAAGFFLLPFVGSLRTLYLIAAILLLLSLWLMTLAFSRAHVAAGLVLLLGILGSEAARYSHYRANEMLDIDTEYNRVRVFRANDAATGKPIRVLTFDPYSTQSAMFLDGDDLVFEYTRFYHLARVMAPEMRKTLMIGGAGYSFPKSYLAAYPEATLDVVEIDPQLTRIAREEFRLPDDPRLRITLSDGRVFLNGPSCRGYDAVLMDAFGSVFAVPFHLTTREAVSKINDCLNDNGVVIFNLGSAIRGPASAFLQAEFLTYREIFPYVYVFKVRPERDDGELQNLIIAACKDRCLPETPTGDAHIDALLGRRYVDQFPLEMLPLTDDLAPIERYSSIAQAK